MKISMKHAPELVTDILRAKLVPFMVGSPGIGKSDLARQIAEKLNLHLIDIRLSQMDPADLMGFPSIQGETASYLPMDMFPIKGKTQIPEGKEGWLILMDEMNSASMAVQAASYKIVLDRMVGNHELHPRTAIMAAGNLMTDKAIVNRISTAMQSRLIHLELEIDPTAWIKWADENNIDHRIKSFINFKPEALHKFDPNHNEETFPCPRTYHFLHRLIHRMPEIPSYKLPLIAGCIGEGMAREFYSYTQIYGKIPTIQDILKSPAEVAFGNEPSIHYALSGLVSHHFKKENSDKLMIFLKRLSIDFQVICIRGFLARDITLKETPAVKEWVSHSAKELFADD